MNSPRELTKEFPPTIVRLVERFFGETPPEATQKALTEGPCSLSTLCFRWAADVVSMGEVENELGSYDSLPPSLRYMKTVRLLSAAIDQAVRRAYGDPVQPAMPSPPPDLECVRIGCPESSLIQIPAKRPERQATWEPEPVSIKVDTFGTGNVRAAEEYVRTFDFQPAAIIKRLDLLRSIYRSTTNYGHLGKPDLPWEQ